MAVLHCNGQTTVFKGQIWNSNSPVKNYTVFIDGRAATTDDAGVFTAAVQNNVSQVTVQPSGNSYIIIYPIGGKGLIPKDPQMITQFIVEPFQSNKYINVYLNSVRQLKDSTGKSQSALKALKMQVDSITRLLYQFKYTQDDLKNARDRQDGIDLFYPEISATLQNYINQVRSIAGAFQYTAAYAFDNPNALSQLVQAINNYNPAYDKLYTNYHIYTQKIQTYWMDKGLTASFEGITDTLLNVIHKQTIYPLNDLKTKINAYFLGQVDNKDKPAAKKAIEDQIGAILPVLNARLTASEQRIQEFQNQLKNNQLNQSL